MVLHIINLYFKVKRGYQITYTVFYLIVEMGDDKIRFENDNNNYIDNNPLL